MTPALLKARPVALPPGIAWQEAEAFEAEHVHAVYASVTQHFSDTRRSPWPTVRGFLGAVRPGDLVLECGCGNGRNLQALAEGAFAVGLDYCLPLLELARAANNKPDYAQGDALSLPFADGTFSHVVCVAVVHHFASGERRLACLRELLRCASPGGRVLVTAWAVEQTMPENARGPEFLLGAGPPDARARGAGGVCSGAGVPQSGCAVDGASPDSPGCPAVEALPGLPPQNSPPAGAPAVRIAEDALVPWTPGPSPPSGSVSGDRYYHFYRAGELLGQAREAGFASCVEVWEAGNWVVSCERPGLRERPKR